MTMMSVVYSLWFSKIIIIVTNKLSTLICVCAYILGEGDKANVTRGSPFTNPGKEYRNVLVYFLKA